MKTTVQKWGNSLAVRIPSAYAKEVSLKNRDSVNISVEEGALVLTPRGGPKPDLKTMLAGITRGNVHAAEEFGGPMGKEVW